MEFALKLADNKEIQSKFYLAEPSSLTAWARLNAEVKKSLKDPNQKYTLKYRDEEGDIVTLTSQNEWEELVREGTREILISSPVNIKIEFMPRNTHPIHLSGLKFYTWAKHEHLGWIKGADLSFDNYEKPFVNNTQLNSSPIKEESAEGFLGVSIQWNQSAQHNHSGYCLFYNSSQLRVGNQKGRLYWPNFIDTDCIVFNGWIEYQGQQRQYWKGAVLDVETMLKNPIPKEFVKSQTNSSHIMQNNNQGSQSTFKIEKFPQQPLDPQAIEDAKNINRFITQLNQLWNIGHRDIKRNLYLLQRFDGNLQLVTANM
jgi:hypothetical protein